MIARVFPYWSKRFSPTDSHAYFGAPTLVTPRYDEVHISVVFTWDKDRAQDLAVQWRNHAKVVKIGGPAYGDPGGEFTPGLYLKQGITITSRGCPKNCGFCLVHQREGKLRELQIKPGNIIQDNNILATSDSHWSRLMTMLKAQRRICFKGGLDKYLLTDQRLQDIRSLSIRELWFACDNNSQIKDIADTGTRLTKAGFKRYALYCYVLIGNDARENIYRLREVYKAGFFPFAQLLRNDQDTITYSDTWKSFQRRWSRPAAIASRNKRYNVNKDFRLASQEPKEREQ